MKHVVVGLQIVGGRNVHEIMRDRDVRLTLLFCVTFVLKLLLVRSLHVVLSCSLIIWVDVLRLLRIQEFFMHPILLIKSLIIELWRATTWSIIINWLRNAKVGRVLLTERCIVPGITVLFHMCSQSC